MVGSLGSVKGTGTGGGVPKRGPSPLAGEGSDDDEFDAYEDTSALGCVCFDLMPRCFDVSIVLSAFGQCE